MTEIQRYQGDALSRAESWAALPPEELKRRAARLKRRLGVGMHDDYGRLIKPQKAPIGSLREGGDMLGGRTLSVVPTRTVALFSGLVKLGADGTAQVPLDIPDFNGELRLMAVAMTDKKVGEASRALTVRDPVVADIVLPRFLAPGDHADAALNLDNVEGPAGSYTATVTTSGPVGLDSGAARTLQPAGFRAIRNHDADLRAQLAAGDGVDDRLQVGARSGKQDSQLDRWAGGGAGVRPQAWTAGW